MDKDQSCIIEGCEGIRGLPGTGHKRCRKHYQEYRRSQPHKQCLVADCTLSANWPGSGRGLCSKHRYREGRYGTTADSGMTRLPDKLSLKDRLRQKTILEPATGCIVWQDKPNSKGYGAICVARRSRPAHKVAWEEYVGPVPSPLVLDHLCENTLCVNVKHLEPVTKSENSRRRWFRPLDKRIEGITYSY